MSQNPFVIPDDVNEATAEALRRMYAAHERVRQRYFSAEAMANEYPLDAPEVVGIHSPDVMRAEPRHRAVG
jgi:hypothetical protein